HAVPDPRDQPGIACGVGGEIAPVGERRLRGGRRHRRAARRFLLQRGDRRSLAERSQPVPRLVRLFPVGGGGPAGPLHRIVVIADRRSGGAPPRAAIARRSGAGRSPPVAPALGIGIIGRARRGAAEGEQGMGARPGRRSFKKLARLTAGWAALLLLTACGQLMLYEGELPVGTSPSAEGNSPAFARRGPLPGRPAYLLTIKYIDHGMRYVDPLTPLFFSPAGEMCFRTKPNYPQVIYATRYRTWCMYPQTVDHVEAVTNDITRINEVHLWCRLAYPQCAH